MIAWKVILCGFDVWGIITCDVTLSGFIACGSIVGDVILCGVNVCSSMGDNTEFPLFITPRRSLCLGNCLGSTYFSRLVIPPELDRYFDVEEIIVSVGVVGVNVGGIGEVGVGKKYDPKELVAPWGTGVLDLMIEGEE